MNQQERDELRAEHQARDNGFLCRTCIRLVPDTDGFRGLNGIASPAKHPCDVIRVLDAWESSPLRNTHIEGQWKNNTENGIVATECTNGLVSPAQKCNHYGVDSGGTDYYGTSNPPQEIDWGYNYCPKCGEKL